MSDSVKIETEDNRNVNHQGEDEGVAVASVSNETLAENPVVAVYRHVKPTPGLLKHIDEVFIYGLHLSLN